MGEGGGPASTVVDARSTTVVEIGTVVVAGSAVVVGGTAAVDGTTAVAGVAVVVRDTVVVAGTTVVVGATVVVGVVFVVGVAVAVGVVVAAVVVDSAEVEVGAAVSELPPHPETTNKTVTATACALTFQVCHPSSAGGGATTGAPRCRYAQRLQGRPMASRSEASGLVTCPRGSVTGTTWCVPRLGSRRTGPSCSVQRSVHLP